MFLRSQWLLHEPHKGRFAGLSQWRACQPFPNPHEVDSWITDPPYADAINYHELSEFFLAWYEKHLPTLFPDWYIDSKRALAIRGLGL